MAHRCLESAPRSQESGVRRQEAGGSLRASPVSASEGLARPRPRVRFECRARRAEKQLTFTTSRYGAPEVFGCIDTPPGRLLSCASFPPRACPQPMLASSASQPPEATEQLIEGCLKGDQHGWNLIVGLPAEGLQCRPQVRRAARPGRGPDAGRLPEDLQGARHLRPARQLSNLADQRQPQPLYRPLSQRAQGARDGGPERRRGRCVTGRHRTGCAGHSKYPPAKPGAFSCEPLKAA